MRALAHVCLRAAALALSVAPAAACRGDTADHAERATPAIALTGRVVDDANLFDPATEKALTDKLAAVESDTQAQFVVVSTRSLNGQPIKAYSMALANNWGIGSAERNDGVMILIAPNERQARIEVGTGLEKALPNPLCEQIMREMVARYRTGDIAAGTIVGVDRIAAQLRATARQTT
ncbi:MAG: TPM domain-containing protein [Tsuneonella suprasediminis]|nr:TPM domain-containing protein [Altererythrobacter sp. N1]